MTDIYEWICREVSKISEERSINTKRAFEMWCLVFAHNDVDYDTAILNTDTLKGYGGGDNGLDGWYQDEKNREFNIWQCKLPDKIENMEFDLKPYKELTGAFESLIAEDKAAIYGEKFVEISSKLINSIEHGYSVVLNIGIAGVMNETAFKNALDLFGILQKDFNANFPETNIRLEFWDLKRFEDEQISNLSTYETLEGTNITFELQTPYIMHLIPEDPTLPKDWAAVIINLNGKSIAQQANIYGPKLFSLNVRFALGANKRIQNIRNSLVNQELSQFFWLYNNGITIVCDGFELIRDKLEGEPGSKYISIKILNPQVVNGCQTVTAFKKMKGKIDGNPSVLTRVILAPNNDIGKEQAVKIAEYTNSQSPVLTRDLKSNDPIQKSIKNKFLNLEPPWFYEVKRGEWGTLKPPQKDVFKNTDGTYRRIDIEHVGQAWRMVTGEPSEALDEKKDLFENDSVYNRIYTRIGAENYLFASKIYNIYDSFWHGNNFDNIRNHSGSYMDDEKLRKMMQIKGFIVAHSVAAFSKAIMKNANWTIDDARYGLSVAGNFDEKAKKWNRIMIKSINDLCNIDDLDKTSADLKKEFKDKAAHGRLMKKISANASILEIENLRKLFE